MTTDTVKVKGDQRTIKYEPVHTNRTGAKEKGVKIDYTRLIPDGTAVFIQVAANEPTNDAGATKLDAEKRSASVDVAIAHTVWARLEPNLVANVLEITY